MGIRSVVFIEHQQIARPVAKRLAHRLVLVLANHPSVVLCSSLVLARTLRTTVGWRESSSMFRSKVDLGKNFGLASHDAELYLTSGLSPSYVWPVGTAERHNTTVICLPSQIDAEVEQPTDISIWRPLIVCIRVDDVSCPSWWSRPCTLSYF